MGQATFIVGAFGGGTSAVAGVVERLGARALRPFWTVNDPRTPQTFESQRYRDLLRRFVSEHDRLQAGDREPLVPMLAAFRDEVRAEVGDAPFFLKHPLSALLLPELEQVFAPSFIFVFRRSAGIEATRARRGWSERFGVEAARRIYSAMMTFYLESRCPVLMLRYEDLAREPERGVDLIADHIGLGGAAERADAVRSVRPQAG